MELASHARIQHRDDVDHVKKINAGKAELIGSAEKKVD